MTKPTDACWRSIRTLARETIAGITPTVPTYRSPPVHYDPVQTVFEVLGEKLARTGAIARTR